ncbi:hypothetical protein B9Z65_6898 [Elsinoe australis]|uniref:BTB domain-containing protein n=1 Tax=Elsinoe australis TaxID=40998 RepID=A0A2P7Z418_9PEZI|nr:hypothetical protein B9Z65_6898 [Elsinoe australis]
MPEKRKSARLAATPSSSAEVESQTPPDAERPAKRIKQKGRSDFPDTDDADVILTIGDTTLYLNSTHLSRNSRFFSEFQPNQLPVTGYLERQGGSLYYAKAYRLRFFTAGEECQNNEVEIKHAGDRREFDRACAAHLAVFRALYDLPLDLPEHLEEDIEELVEFEKGQFMRELAKVVAIFKCSSRVKSAVVNEILRLLMKQSKDALRQTCQDLLEAADALENEELFDHLVVHTAAKRSQLGGMNPEWDVDLIDAVEMTGYEMFDKKVSHAMLEIERCFQEGSFNGFLVAGLIRRHLQTTAPAQSGTASEETYNALRRLYDSREGMEFWDTNLAQRVDAMDFRLLAPRSRPTMTTVALSMNVKAVSLKKELKETMQRIHDVLRPLFMEDRNMGYFTCITFPETCAEYPWIQRAKRRAGERVD